MRLRAHRLIVHLRREWMGALALFLVLTGGVAYAANTIGSSDVINESLLSEDLKNNNILSADLKSNQVASSDVRDDTLVNGGLTTADIAADALTDADLASSAQFNGATAGGALTGGYPSPFIATGAVDSAAVRDDREGAGGLFSIDIANDGCKDCGLLGEDIAEDTLTGDDINEATLSGVNADTLNGAGLCRTDGVLTLAGGTAADPPNTQELCTEGPLSIRAYCDKRQSGGTDNVVADAVLQIDTSTDDSFFSGSTFDVDFDAAEGFGQVVQAFVGTAPGADVETAAFGAGASDGSQLSGVGVAHVLKSGGADPDLVTVGCSFVLNATN